MKVWAVHEYFGYNEEPLRHVFDNQEAAEEYSRLINHGSANEAYEYELLSEVPEHQTLWRAHATFSEFEDWNSPEPRTASEAIWDADHVPADLPTVTVNAYQKTGPRPQTLAEIIRSGPSVAEILWPGQPPKSPNTWQVTATSLDRDEAEQMCRDKYREIAERHGRDEAA